MGMVLALAIASGGCFNYIPTELGAVPPGENVRVWVSRAMVEQLSQVGTFEQPVVRGRLVSRDEEGLFMWIPVGARQIGFHSTELGQDVRIPLTDIVQVERREVNRIGTGALIAGGLGAASVVLFMIMEAWGDQLGEEVEEPTELMTPILRLPISIP